MPTAKEWPTHLDFRDALSNTTVCFVDDDLRAGEVHRNTLGFPLAATGGFASVYRVSKNGREWAVRCFTSPLPADARDRYAAISSHLTSSGLPYTVDFTFDHAGIRVEGQMYPTVKMAWLQGVNLNRYVRQLIESGNVAGLDRLITRWKTLTDDLIAASVAHGDLQHGNVLVTSTGELRLVDYDGMFVPALGGREATELGQKAYQHPNRTKSHFNGELDRYASLTVFTALHALRCDRGLWSDYDNEENLLFVPDDHSDPSSSGLFARLLTMPSPIDRLATALANAALTAPTETPTLSAALTYAAPLKATITARGSSSTGTARAMPWFKAAAAAEAGVGARHTTATTWSPTLRPVWSRPGVEIVQWIEQEPVYRTVVHQETEIRRPLRRLFRATAVAVERTETVRAGSRPVRKQRLDHIATTSCPTGVAVSNGKVYTLASDHVSVWPTAAAKTPERVLSSVPETEAIAASSHVVAVAHRRGITLLATAGGRHEIAREGDSRFYDVAVSPSGAFVAAGLGRQAATVYTASSGTRVGRFQGFRRKVRSVAFVGDGRLLAGSDDSTVALFDIRTRRRISSSAAHTAPITALAVDRAGMTLASGDESGDLHLHDKDLRDLGAIHLGSCVTALGFAPDGLHIVVAIAASPVKIVNTRSHRVVASLGRSEHATSVAFTENGDLLTVLANGLLVRWTSDASQPATDLSLVRSPSVPRPTSNTGSKSRRPAPSKAQRRTPPGCPKCGRSMVTRHRRNPPHKLFWGCPSYPRCQGTRSM